MSIKSEQNFSNFFITFTTIIFAITSLITVYISISALKEERESIRPYFTFIKSPSVVVLTEAENQLLFSFTLSNVGQHPVSELHIQTIIVDSKLDKSPLHTDQHTLLNYIPQNNTTTLDITVNKIDNIDYIKEHYIVMSLKYTDPIIRKEHEQIYYLKWLGIENGKVHQIFHASKKDKDKIVNYLKKL